MPSREPLETMIETFSMLASMTGPSSRWSDAAARLGNAGDPGSGLGRALGEQLVELLDGDAGGLAQDADRGPGALGLVVGAHEPDDLPVPWRQVLDARGPGDLRGHVLGPLTGVGEESLVVDGDALVGVGSGGPGQQLREGIIGARRRRRGRAGGSCRGRASRS